MAETTRDALHWPPLAFDPLNPGPGFSLEPGVAGDEELWYTGFDEPPSSPRLGQVSSRYAFPGRHGERKKPRLEDDVHFHATSATDGDDASAAPYTLGSLLRSTSQLASERALYMNVPAHSFSVQGSSSPQPVVYHSSSSPITDSPPSEADWERDPDFFEFTQVYQLPPATTTTTTTAGDAIETEHESERDFAPMHTQAAIDPVAAAVHIAPTPTPIPHHHHHHQKKRKQYETNDPDDDEHLIPLEMPDGTTRFTSNWLPVDPQGGFTIPPPPPRRVHFHHTAAAAAAVAAVEHSFDPSLPDYPPFPPECNYHDAFISLDAGLSHAGGGGG
ncbi:hypothetical protein P175DRAFT_0491890 [Aspergillus ochraceoroseus IBT 24754]|uniref:Uncharacterized protein n=1 Tax=Aspergillus ochraceoroseus IBT 24754 TaxID=1392256 RepID=A0A2T5M4T0_9EURO|nr:uncharacterized protein P175DRAFT_0491890 [Aspergillus ochraceoroseus IBT 24754]PTU23540.1 hypothetical protein P175DRAFT_0491890 [Aspergillus ochraceoroseus IBT 24754]